MKIESITQEMVEAARMAFLREWYSLHPDSSFPAWLIINDSAFRRAIEAVLSSGKHDAQ